MAALRVLVIARDPLVRSGLAAALATGADIVVSGQADGVDASAAVELHRPDVLVWDLGPDPAGAAGALDEHLRGYGRLGAGLVLLAPRELAISARQATAAAGLSGFALLNREAGTEVLLSGLRAAAAGLAVLDARLAGAVGPGDEDEAPVEPLTARELDVLQLMAEGLANKAIAARLGIGESTVKFHVNAILGKLAAQSRTEAVARGTRLGLVRL
jgi:DNA-binding NarL/FixJ family response regulator